MQRFKNYFADFRIPSQIHQNGKKYFDQLTPERKKSLSKALLITIGVITTLLMIFIIFQGIFSSLKSTAYYIEIQNELYEKCGGQIVDNTLYHVLDFTRLNIVELTAEDMKVAKKINDDDLQRNYTELVYNDQKRNITFYEMKKICTQFESHLQTVPCMYFTELNIPIQAACYYDKTSSTPMLAMQPKLVASGSDKREIIITISPKYKKRLFLPERLLVSYYNGTIILETSDSDLAECLLAM